MDGSYINHLRFSDDIVLFSHGPQELLRYIQHLYKAGEPIGLRINLKKNLVMFNRFTKQIQISDVGQNLDAVDIYVCLGQRILMQGATKVEVEQRIKCVSQAFGRLGIIFKKLSPTVLKENII